MTTCLLILARAIHFGSGMMLVGVVAFRWLILLPAFVGETDEEWLNFAPLFSRLRRILLWSGALLLLSGFALFWAVTAEMSDSSLAESFAPDTLATVLFQTQFGHVCQWRLGFAVILGAILCKLTYDQWLERRRVSILEAVAGILAIALLVSVAWTGHAAARSGPELPWRILADAAHLLAVSLWPTGLLPFALFIGHARMTKDPARFRPVLAATHRFSTMSFVTVGILVATGFINAFFILGSLAALFTTGYGGLLCLKLLLFFVILGFAARNRYHLVPLLTDRAKLSDHKADAGPILGCLRRFVLTELALAVAIVVVVAVLGITPPPS